MIAINIVPPYQFGVHTVPGPDGSPHKQLVLQDPQSSIAVTALLNDTDARQLAAQLTTGIVIANGLHPNP